ncbi:NAD(P)H-dependent glycerol-3-phosphate dehydrogenase [Lichenibacterium dinghuense]|uniref:NAD(P)H-dependent glycerol-3-phosphate dehydrogenase n=1 Tax=Lichenibacterium dinghuense TaxID=2895977 RepID=UPI001F284BA2|nr:NAD(P)H-dependent glycerol-3-phosphate dehydrogenase [Lichenibacterium sp. 6Y81]
MAFDRIAVLGAGAWGTALATVAARPGRRVTLWSRDPAEAAAMADARENSRSLPGVRLDDAIVPTASHDDLAAADLVLLVVPAQHLRATLDALPPFGPGVPVVLCAKGIEAGTGLLMSEVLAARRPGHPAAALSGPSFAADVGRGRPTAVTVAAEDGGLARRVAEALAKPAFRPYHADDLRGVEIGGAAKNVLAIACGVAAGMDLGASASAALIARGFAELGRFGRASGARAETLMGLSGLGDLVLTCASVQSRNFAFGRALGLGEALEAAGAGRLAEGVATAPVLVRLARERGVDMPVAEAVAALVAGRTTPAAALDALLSRPSRAEAGD